MGQHNTLDYSLHVTRSAWKMVVQYKFMIYKRGTQQEVMSPPSWRKCRAIHRCVSIWAMNFNECDVMCQQFQRVYYGITALITELSLWSFLSIHIWGKFNILTPHAILLKRNPQSMSNSLLKYLSSTCVPPHISVIRWLIGSWCCCCCCGLITHSPSALLVYL